MQHHRVNLTEEHFHLARRFMVMNRLPSTRIAVQRMIEIVSERKADNDNDGEGLKLPEDDQGRRNGL